jgi:hypothetical protein
MDVKLGLPPLGERRRLEMFEKRVLRKMFASKREILT